MPIVSSLPSSVNTPISQPKSILILAPKLALNAHACIHTHAHSPRNS
ncbi:hypothetical protein I314_03580 [Cryptococcus bacillisporus CA1873]|uniref:Uncharacterized protein n=2 Tax=Cryptococcus gattii TaxID=552467 RepID=A0A0D0VKW6_CRYGA|nr:hypothetical protein I312_03391 [Cryptococcus bacillisporus CA1280]KIR60291.1 hypothetical protein I314_03580 [Cryptococcus bacillisporus CA1873]|eukprot:KIR60291.1 hypothetical protein I314_03580 [Cryptococcus gattii CA1873]